MRGNMFLRVFTSLLLFALLVPCRSVAAELSPAERQGIIAKLTALVLEGNHYRQQRLDENISREAFRLLVERIDPNRMFFLAGDMEKFSRRAGDLGREIVAGDVSIAGELYEIYKSRFREYYDFAVNMLDSEVDFSVDETIEPDRSKAPFFSTMDEMRDFWRKKIKNDLLYFRLVRRSMEERADEESGDDPEITEIRALWDASTPEEKLKRRLRDISINIEKTDDDDLLAMLLGALAHAYGPHSDYNSEKMTEEFNIDMSLHLSGIGATLSTSDGLTRIVELVPGGPADKDGTLKPEDRIIAVAQEGEQPVDVIDMPLDDVVKLIRGPAGTQVTLTYLPGRKGRNAVPESVTLTREVVKLKDSEVSGSVREVPDPADPERSIKVGVIDFDRFYVDFQAWASGDPDYKSCAGDMQREINRLKEDGVQAIVIDLRYNGGGGFAEALKISGMFIKSGPLLQVRGADGRISLEKDPDPGIVYDGPLVVLTSKLTASASEILTGAVRDYARGVVVGDANTYGKGTILDVVDLRKDLLSQIKYDFPAGSIHYETAQFFGISGISNQQLGIPSDIVLPSLTGEMEIGESSNPNHLPWDRISPVSYSRWDPELAPKIAELRRLSEARRAVDPEFMKIAENIEVYHRYRERRSITLNEEARWQEYLAEKEVADREEEMELSGSPSEDEAVDPILDEAVNIAADYVCLLRPDHAG